ncbi:AAA family ATPase [Pseudomonas sp. P155]|uniref:AAA family ATPase n=1 Tax=Pseudomonas neuropathica TaxID=2730425 RepID=A0ABS0BHQ6_9PSED|nr:AAA family ATPase [Pseudomonas neuropathica]MBF6034009.1 AAA family ATPase [Pseudomonas neuropathica]
MIRTIEIQNFKSIDKVKVELGRINVFIGENGAGKSNFLEAIALAGAANASKLDNEFLMSRGIRVTSAPLMRPQFTGFSDAAPILININEDNGNTSSFTLQNDNKHYSNWTHEILRNNTTSGDYYKSRIGEFVSEDKANLEKLKESISELMDFLTSEEVNNLLAPDGKRKNTKIQVPTSTLIGTLISNFKSEYDAHLEDLNNFVIYSPENTALRLLEKEGQLEPLGINGEGLIKLLLVISEDNDHAKILEINNCLKVLGWFDRFSVSDKTSNSTAVLDITDRYLKVGQAKLDHRSANEGFMFLLFYFALFSTDLTPKIFAIDNIDASLNPKLCSKLIQELSTLAESHDKQALLTTHNPAILDGLNLEDDEQRLFVISRNPHGHTRIKRITKPKGQDLKLSEMFMRGVIGGLPKGF